MLALPGTVPQTRRASGSKGGVARMLSGFNNNVRYQGVLFHVQTEDSGRAHPHVITHLYHGGTIVASEKRSYADRLDESDLSSAVRRVMEEQHRSMLRRLKDGQFDDVIRERLGADILGEPAIEAPAADPREQTQRSATPFEASPPGPAPTPAADASRSAPPDPVPGRAGSDASDDVRPPLDEVVLDYLLESARRRKRAKP